MNVPIWMKVLIGSGLLDPLSILSVLSMTNSNFFTFDYHERHWCDVISGIARSGFRPPVRMIRMFEFH